MSCLLLVLGLDFISFNQSYKIVKLCYARLSSSVSRIIIKASSSTFVEVLCNIKWFHCLILTASLLQFQISLLMMINYTMCKQEGSYQESDSSIPIPKVIIDQDSDQDATVVEITFGDRLGALLDTVGTPSIIVSCVIAFMFYCPLAC